MWTPDWSQDLLSFRSLNQESVDALQTARSSSLVDGRLAHIVLSENKNSFMSQNTSLFETLKLFVLMYFLSNFPLLYFQEQASEVTMGCDWGWTFYPNITTAPTQVQLYYLRANGGGGKNTKMTACNHSLM